MFTVQVAQECGCFKRSDMKAHTKHESKDDALMQAQEMVQEMNNQFCKKHKFQVMEKSDTFVIAMMRP